MAQGEIRARYIGNEDDPRDRTTRRSDEVVRSDCTWDTPCRLLAGVFIGMGDALASTGTRARRLDDESPRRTGEVDRRSLSACIDYEFGCRTDSQNRDRDTSSRASFRAEAGDADLDIEVRGGSSETPPGRTD